MLDSWNIVSVIALHIPWHKLVICNNVEFGAIVQVKQMLRTVEFTRDCTSNQGAGCNLSKLKLMCKKYRFCTHGDT
jgi:hypothetical protein